MQLLAGEIASLGCALPDKFVAVGIIAKLPATWRDFATTLKHKREDISTEDLVIALDVEERQERKILQALLLRQRMVLVQILLRRNSTTRTRAKCRCRIVGSLRKLLTSRRRRRMRKTIGLLCVWQGTTSCKELPPSQEQEQEQRT
jgi:hypothetical protein